MNTRKHSHTCAYINTLTLTNRTNLHPTNTQVLVGTALITHHSSLITRHSSLPANNTGVGWLHMKALTQTKQTPTHTHTCAHIKHTCTHQQNKLAPNKHTGFGRLPANTQVLVGTSLITHHSSLITRHSSLITHHSSLITRHSSLPANNTGFGWLHMEA